MIIYSTRLLKKLYILISVAGSLGCHTVGTKKLSIEGFICSVPESVYLVYELTAVRLSSQITFHTIDIDKLLTNVSMPGRSQL